MFHEVHQDDCRVLDQILGIVGIIEVTLLTPREAHMYSNTNCARMYVQARNDTVVSSILSFGRLLWSC